MDQGMLENYSRVEVFYSILDAVQSASGLAPGEIVQAVGLDDAVVAKYLGCMVGKDLLSCQDNKYLITREGDGFREKVEKLMSDQSLDYQLDVFLD